MTSAITGVGYTEFTSASGRSVLDLATAACRAACEDAGVDPRDVDGIASYMLGHDSVPAVALATTLGVRGLRFVLDLDLGGQAPCALAAAAAAAIDSGRADHVLVFRAMNGRSGDRVGTMAFHGRGSQYRYPIGYDAYMMYCAMWASRFLHETGQTERDLAAVVVAQREHATRNPRAVRRSPVSVDELLAAPYVVEPFRAADCTVEVDGACAVLVTSLARARDLRQPPAVIASGGYRAGPRPGVDIGDHLLWNDYTRNFASHARDELFAVAGLGPSDVEFAEIYDCFSSTALMTLEAVGLCERGASGAFVAAGETGAGGRLPVNTHGGLLCEGYLHGMNTLAEAVLQIQGRGGAGQVARHDVGLVTSGALMDGSTLILRADR